MAFNARHAEPVLALIRKHESRDDYGIVYGGIPPALRPRALTDMTIAEVMAWQDRIRPQVRSTAAGAYQIIRNTMREIVAATGIDTRRKFDRSAQDEMAMYLLRKRGFQAFLDGTKGEAAMGLSLAQEWASMPVLAATKGASRQIKAGQSYYAGDGLNKALVSPEVVRSALAAARAIYRDPPISMPQPVAGIPPAILIAAVIMAVAAIVIFA